MISFMISVVPPKSVSTILIAQAYVPVVAMARVSVAFAIQVVA